MVVEMEVVVQGLEQLGAADEVAGVDELVLQTAPQALDKNIGLSRQLRLMQAA